MIRAHFSALEGEDVFLDNAGGSQVPVAVADRVRDYMLTTYVQVGADYETSLRATATVERARELVRVLMHSAGVGEVVLGPSTSALLAMLADCYGRVPDPSRNEIIVAESGHEANVGPWVRLADRGFRVVWWKVDPERQACPVEALEAMLGRKTRIVALPHVSNLLGRIDDIVTVTRMAHEAGARVVVDGVAYAPHRAMDVAEWEVDWYVCSHYKVYGPHMASLFGRHDAFAEIEGPNHFFVPKGNVPCKMELGGVLHEACAGLLGLAGYLAMLAGTDPSAPFDRAAVHRAFETMTVCERPLQERLLSYLRGKPAVKLIGPAQPGPDRVPTVSFVDARKSSREIAVAANQRRLGIRYGHFYAHRLCTALGLEPDDGVVRASLVHYNTLDEVDRLIGFLETVL